MAVVFISPKEKQKLFFVGITVLLILFLASVFLGIFVLEPKEESLGLVFNRPKVNINMEIFDSDIFKNLKSFSQMEIQYQYKAKDQQGAIIEGFIVASSLSNAMRILEGAGLSGLSVKELEVGRENPFAPYFQPDLNPTPPIIK